MQNKQQLMLAMVVIATVVVGLAVMPALSEQVFAKNSIPESKNKGQQGEIKSDGKRQGHGGSGCPFWIVNCDTGNGGVGTGD